MTSTTTQQRIAALRQRELDSLRIAGRAHRDALEAIFFGDDLACHNHLVAAQEATYTARICAEEAADLATHNPEGEHL